MVFSSIPKQQSKARPKTAQRAKQPSPVVRTQRKVSKPKENVFGAKAVQLHKTAMVDMVLPVIYKTFTGSQGMASVSLSPFSSPMFAAEASGHQYYAVTGATVEYKPVSAMIRTGQIAMGATNDISRLVPAFNPFEYLEGAVKVQSVTKGARATLTPDLWHPIKGSRYATDHTGAATPPVVMYAFTYTAVADSGIPLADGTVLGELVVRLRLQFAVITPPSLSSSVNVTHVADTLVTLTPREMFSAAGALLSSKTVPQLMFVGMPLGNPYWGGAEDTLNQPPDALAITSPCDASAHLRFTLHRLVENADAATPALVLAHSLQPYVATSGVLAQHGSIETLGHPPVISTTAGYNKAGEQVAIGTHTLITSRTAIHIKARVHQLPNRLPLSNYHSGIAEEVKGLISLATEHPLEACFVIGLGIVTGANTYGAGFLVGNAILAGLAASGTAATAIAAIQSSISGNVATYPLGSAPTANSGVIGSGFQVYPLSPNIGSFKTSDSLVNPDWMPGDPMPAQILNAPIYASSQTANGQPVPPPPAGGSVLGTHRFAIEMHGSCIFSSNSVNENVHLVPAYTTLAEVTDAATNALLVGDGGYSSHTYVATGNVMAVRLDHPGQHPPPMHIETLTLTFAAANNTSMPIPADHWQIEYSLYNSVSGHLQWGPAAASQGGPERHTNAGVYIARFDTIPFNIAVQPPLATSLGTSVHVRCTATNSSPARGCGFVLTLTGYANLSPSLENADPSWKRLVRASTDAPPSAGASSTRRDRKPPSTTRPTSPSGTETSERSWTDC